MRYGDKPINLGIKTLVCNEMMFYQYLPIKFPKNIDVFYEKRLKFLDSLVGTVCCDFIGSFGLDRYVNSFVYLTVKSLFQKSGCSLNREGYHSDGFLTDDINYIWSDINPTVFNDSDFNLSLDDRNSLHQMSEQALIENEFEYPECTLLRLNQFSIHKVGEVKKEGVRTFIKISFSNDKYDLIGNSHNYELNYNWDMRPRSIDRNIPQKL